VKTGASRHFSVYGVYQDLSGFGTGCELPSASFVDLPRVEN
jgi:hypothetical protein